MKLLILLCLIGCTNIPKVISVTGNQQIGQDAIEGWSKLGFTYTTGPSDLNIEIKTEAYFSKDCDCFVLGHAEGSTVYIDPHLEGVALQHTARHEFGHILLQSMHLESYGQGWKDGIMSWTPYPYGVPRWILEPTKDDYAMACYTIGECVN